MTRSAVVIAACGISLAAWLAFAAQSTAQTIPTDFSGSASATADADKGILYLKFLDARTGGGVKPDKIAVDKKPVRFDVEAGSLVRLQLPNGVHQVSVESEEHEPIGFSATVSGESAPVMQIELDPKKSSDYEPVAANAAILEGNVSDADTGALLKGVSVTLPDSRMATVTANSGYYRFDIVTGVSDEDRQPAITMEVKADGYTSLRLKNVALAPGERRRMPVRLDRVTSDTLAAEIVEIDEASPPGGPITTDWVYDATVR